jgi:hypothetical protein
MSVHVQTYRMLVYCFVNSGTTLEQEHQEPSKNISNTEYL